MQLEFVMENITQRLITGFVQFQILLNTST